MTPGMVLSALAALDHAEAAKALEGVLTAASPSGGYAEMNRPDDTPSREIWGMHRVRPWEGGINGSAVLRFLTGFEPDAANRRATFTPRLPDGADSMTVRNLRVADANLTLEVELEGGEKTVRITCEEADAPVGVLLVALAIALCSSVLGILIAALARTENQIGGLSSVILWAAGILGGSFVPLFILEQFLGTLPRVVPHYWANRAFENLLIRGLGVGSVVTELGALLGFTVVFFALGIWRFSFD
jgi:hypothetical protein